MNKIKLYQSTCDFKVGSSVRNYSNSWDWVTRQQKSEPFLIQKSIRWYVDAKSYPNFIYMMTDTNMTTDH